MQRHYTEMESDCKKNNIEYKHVFLHQIYTHTRDWVVCEMTKVNDATSTVFSFYVFFLSICFEQINTALCVLCLPRQFEFKSKWKLSHFLHHKSTLRFDHNRCNFLMRLSISNKTSTDLPKHFYSVKWMYLLFPWSNATCFIFIFLLQLVAIHWARSSVEKM